MPVGARFRQVLRELFSVVDPNYATRSGELYEMYRCGTVHQFKPKNLRNNAGQFLCWLNYRGIRNDAQINFRGRLDTVSHLNHLADPGSNEAWLAVSSDCLVDDLEAALDAFVDHADHAARVAAWNTVAPHFIDPAPYQFVI